MINEFNAYRALIKILEDEFLDNTGLPPQVTLVSPADAAPGIDPGNADFQWQAAGIDYEILISSDSNFTDEIYKQSGIKYLRATIPNDLLSLNTAYYWKVRARNNSGYGAWSAARSFTTLSDALSLASLAFWGDSTQGLLLDNTGTPSIRKWTSAQGLTSWLGHPTKANQPVVNADGSFSFDVTNDILLEQDTGTNIAGTIFFGSTNNEWTVLIWEKRDSSVSAYLGLTGLNQYSANYLKKYSALGYYDVEQYTASPATQHEVILANADADLDNNYILFAGVWNKLTIRELVYNKSKVLKLDAALNAVGSGYSTNNQSIRFEPRGRRIRYLVIFKRALSKAEIEKFYDMTINSIP